MEYKSIISTTIKCLQTWAIDLSSFDYQSILDFFIINCIVVGFKKTMNKREGSLCLSPQLFPIWSDYFVSVLAFYPQRKIYYIWYGVVWFVWFVKAENFNIMHNYIQGLFHFRCNDNVINHNLCYNCGWYASCIGCYSTDRLADELMWRFIMYLVFSSKKFSNRTPFSPLIIDIYVWNVRMSMAFVYFFSFINKNHSSKKQKNSTYLKHNQIQAAFKDHYLQNWHLHISLYDCL